MIVFYVRYGCLRPWRETAHGKCGPLDGFAGKDTATVDMIMPILAVADVEEVLGFLTGRLAFQEQFSLRDDASGKLVTAGVQFGDSMLMLGPAEDDETAKAAGKGIVLYLYTDRDFDAYFEQVKGQPGVRVVEEPVDQFWSDRTFTIQDPFGFTWQFAKSLGSDVDLPEGVSMEMVGAPA